MPKYQQSQSLQVRISQTIRANYLLFLPKGYRSRGSQRWPMILFLHGAGERGTILAKVTAHGPPKIVQKRPDFPFIVVSPQCPTGETWSNDVLLALLDEVTKTHRVDQGRICLTGMSMGGFGTWNLGLMHPEKFAAIAPICGGGDTLAILLADARTKKRLRALPVWAFHGGKDEIVRLDESERMVDALRRIGNDAKLTVYPDAAHDSWTATYDSADLYEWFLQQPTPQASPKSG